MPAGLSLAPFRDYLRAPEPTYIELDMSTRPAQRAERLEGWGTVST